MGKWQNYNEHLNYLKQKNETKNLLHPTSWLLILHKETLGGKRAWYICRGQVCPQNSLHHPCLLMPPCQWRYINITAPLSSAWHWWLSVTHIEYTALISSFKFILILPLVLFHSACAALRFSPYYGMYFSTNRIRWSAPVICAQSKKTIRGQWAEQTADKVTPGEQYLFMKILQLSLGICPGIVVLIPHLECWTFLAQRVLSPSVTSPFSPAIKYG